MINIENMLELRNADLKKKEGGIREHVCEGFTLKTENLTLIIFKINWL